MYHCTKLKVQQRDFKASADLKSLLLNLIKLKFQIYLLEDVDFEYIKMPDGKFDDGREDKSDFLARMFMMGKIQIDEKNK